MIPNHLMRVRFLPLLQFDSNLNEVLEKFGKETVCYLSGEKINLYENNYNFDHIIPTSRGGKNSLDNLGITHQIVNAMKSDLLIDEFLEWCIKILEYNGYIVKKRWSTDPSLYLGDS